MTDVASSNDEFLTVHEQERKMDVREDNNGATNEPEVSPKRVVLPENLYKDEEDSEKLDKEQFLILWKKQEKYIDYLETRLSSGDSKDEKVIYFIYNMRLSMIFRRVAMCASLRWFSNFNSSVR